MMTDENGTQNGSDGEKPRKKRCRRRRGRYIAATVILAVLAAVGIGAAVKHSAYAGWHDGPHFEKFVDHRLDHVLDEVDATDEQKAKIKPILLAASEDMRAVYLEMRGSREAFVAALSSAEIDRQSIEVLRTERLASMDQASQRMIAAIADAAEVLTPAQRVELAELMERFSHRHD